MSYTESSIDIIGKVVAAMTFPVKVLSVATSGTKHTLTVCDIYHAQPGFSVTIAGNKYVITGINGTTTMIVKGTPAPIAPVSFDLYTPFFFHGTPTQQGVELNQQKQAFDKTPMVWFYEQFTDRFIEDQLSKTEREITMRLFFLTQAKTEKWLTDDSYHNAIEPMRRLAENFKNQLAVPQGGVKRFDTDLLTFRMLNYHKFGVFINNKGMEKSLWADKLAGCEMSITLPVFRDEPCPDDNCL